MKMPELVGEPDTCAQCGRKHNQTQGHRKLVKLAMSTGIVEVSLAPWEPIAACCN
jgi:hypothetical protein